VEIWEQSNIFSAGLCLFRLNFCQETFARAKIFFSSQNENQVIFAQMKQGLGHYIGSSTPRSGSVYGDLLKFTCMFLKLLYFFNINCE